MITKYKEFDIIKFVDNKHKGQKYGRKPYIYHIIEVKKVCDKYIDLYDWNSYDKYVIETAVMCHDLLEDTDTTKEELIDLFGEDVYKIVFNVTGIGVNRKERNMDAYNKIPTDNRSIFVKLCDRISNITESITNRRKMDMYKIEYNKFKNNIFNGEFIEMWEHLDRLIKL